MIEQQQVTKANEFATAFETFLTAHPVVTCIALAWVVSWVITITARPFLTFVRDELERHVVRLFDVLIATAAAALMWPGDHIVVWALAIGGSSPIAYLLLSEALCWKWPGLRKYLSLREFTTEPQEPQP